MMMSLFLLVDQLMEEEEEEGKCLRVHGNAPPQHLMYSSENGPVVTARLESERDEWLYLFNYD